VSTPNNQNYLSPVGFRLILKRLPNVEFFCKRVSLPSMTLGEVAIPTPLGASNYEPGSKLSYDPISVTFHVDEDMRNYEEINEWMVGLSAPIDHQQYVSYVQQSAKSRPRENVFSDAALQILTSHKNVSKTYKFSDCFPTNLTPLDFDVGDTEIQYLEATLTLRYVSYKIV